MRIADFSTDMERPSQTLARLELETQAYHRDADQPWLDLMTPFLTRHQYADQLARAYCFEAPVESALAYTPHVTSLVGTRARSRLIAHDLFALDYSQARLAPRLVAPFPTVADALGWLYVVERSMLLQDGIRRHLLAHLPEVGNAFSYLSTYDGRVAERWSVFGKLLDRVGVRPEIANEIVAAAHAGFECVRPWFRHVDQDARRRVG